MTGKEQTIITLRWDSRLPSKTTCDVDMLYPCGLFLLYKHEYYNVGEFLMGIPICYKYTLGGKQYDMIELRDTIENKADAIEMLQNAIVGLK